MRSIRTKEEKKDKPIITVVYSKDGVNGFKEAYRLLAKKVLEEKHKCTQQSMSE